jgi:hypothetical protein
MSPLPGRNGFATRLHIRRCERLTEDCWRTVLRRDVKVSYGGSTMKQLIIGSIVLLLGSLGWSTPSIGGSSLAPHGEIRIVDTSPLNWTSGRL